MAASQLLQVKLLSPVKPLANLEVNYISVPGVEGYIGVKPGHAALISELKTGIVTVEGSGQSLHYFISGGYLEVFENKVAVLVDVIEQPHDIDLERAQEAEKRAVARLQDTTNLDLDIGRALASLERARARLKLATLKNQSK